MPTKKSISAKKGIDAARSQRTKKGAPVGKKISLGKKK